MNKRLFTLFIALLVLAVAGNALANRFDSFEATADCDGFLVTGAAKIGQSDRPGVDMDYTISLSQNGDVLEEQTGSIYVEALMDADPFSLEGAFENLPSGTFEISGVFVLPNVADGDSVRTFSAELSCGEDACAERPRFWKRNPGAWTVQTIDVGFVSYNKDQAIDKMSGCYRHQVLKRLYRHTLAAKLNLANGVTGIDEMLINDADLFLASHDPHRCMSRAEKREARRLKNQLREYNRGCSNKSFEVDEDGFDDFADETSWDDMKAMYR